jgi:RNA polymerase sigma factor (sigma-70 family)
MEKTNTESGSMLQSLAEGRMSVLDQLYDRYRNDFLRWAGSRFQLKNRDDLLDAWHDTMIMFYEQVRDKKLTHLTCDIKTYLFTIGYRRLIKLHKKTERIDLVDEIDVNINIDESINVLESEAMSERKQQLLMTVITELPEKSRQVLIYRFLEGKTVSEIKRVMGYASENAVSVTLSRGLKQLKELISQRMASQKEWEQ